MRIVISAGEVSGDEHAGKIALALRAAIPDVELSGMGGRHLRAAGVTTVVDAEASASAMGFLEVASQLPKLRKALNQMKRLLTEWRPDVLIVIDFPDFHFMLSKFAKRLGIKVLYFVIPKMWIWRTGRIEHFKRYIDHAAVIFPFEREFCKSRGYDHATYVGHPFSMEWQNQPALDRNSYLQKLGLIPSDPVVALLPGSRRGEIKRHLSSMLGGFAELSRKYPKVQGIIPVPGTISANDIKAVLPPGVRIVVTEGDSLSAMRVADIGLIKSGTSNLQASFCELPFVMFFIATRLTEWIVRAFVRTKEFSIVNLLRNGTVLELVQQAANPQRIATELSLLLTSEAKREEVRERLRKVNGMLRSFDPYPDCNEAMSPYDRTAVIARRLGSQ